jgi:hypothetical protein
LRFRVGAPNEPVKYIARNTGFDDTEQNRSALRSLAQLVGAAIRAGKTLAEIDAIIGLPASGGAPEVVIPPTAPSGPTLADYYKVWIAEQTPLVRKAQALDYRRHLTCYVLPALGRMPLAALKPSDIRALQAELLTRGKSVKYVKNIIAGSFRALIQQARIDELVTRDVFAGLKWPAWNPPKPDPFTAKERNRILRWFREKRFRWLGDQRHQQLLHRRAG